MIKHRPDIDGLRALAVMPVVLFRAFPTFSGGFVGVDIFFVISGFLITTIILREISEHTFSVAAFWERRIRRIFPALIVVVFATLVTAWFLYLPADFIFVGKSTVAQSVLLSNVFFFRHTGYFDGASDTMPLLHTWSLAAEEQFYLLFPLFLMFLARFKWFSISRSIACLAIGSFALSVADSYYDPSAAFYLLPSRAWELMVGALLAANPGWQLSGRWLREWAGLSGVGLILYSIFFYTDKTRFPGLAAVPPCLGAALIILSSGAGPTLVGRVLSLRPVVFVGLISYSLYLWHWPFLVFSKYGSIDPQSRWLGIDALAASFIPAILSWRFIETPFRKRLVCPRRPQILALAGCSMLLLIILGRSVYISHGIPSRLPTQALSYADRRRDFAFSHQISPRQAAAGEFAELGGQSTNLPVEFVLWGDSHAEAMASVLDELCRRFSVRGVQATHAATAPLLGYVSEGASSLEENSPAFSQSVLNFISQRHVKVVILAAYWTAYKPSDSINEGLVITVQAVEASGARVYVVKDPPIPRFDVPRLAAITIYHHGDVGKLAGSPDEYRADNSGFASGLNRISKMGAIVLDTPRFFLNSNGLYDVVRDDKALYYDSQHLSVEGAKLLEPMFEPLFREIKQGIVAAPSRVDGIKDSQETISSPSEIKE